MEMFWNAFFWMVPAWVFIMIPFCTFYYEADDGQLMAGTSYAPNPEKRSKIGQALCYELFVLIFIGLIFFVTFLLLSDTSIPVKHFDGPAFTGSASEALYTIPAQVPFSAGSLASFGALDTLYLAGVKAQDGTDEIVLTVSVSTFFAGLMAWLGWFVLAIFGGIGMAALPLDLVLAYVNRPRHLDAAEYAEIQVNLRERVNELVDVGELIKIEREERAQAGLTTKFGSWSLDSEKRKAARDERQAILGFKQAVYLLERDTEEFQAMTTARDTYNPLIPYISLVLGFFAGIISLFWFIHIIVYVYPSEPYAPFLNSYFAWFDNWFPLFGVLSVALFTLYLLICAVKGCFKVGVRFLFLQLHPMKPGKTYMSSFMFNIGLVLLCAMPVVQFAQDAFADYAAFSEIRQIFGVQIQYLQFFTLFWENNIFVYVFMGFIVLTSIYLGCKPRDTATTGQALRDRLKARAA